MAETCVLRSVLSFRCGVSVALALVSVASPISALAERESAFCVQRILSVCDRHRVVIVGEHHAQPSGRGLFLELVKALVSRGERILVGLEIAADRQGDLDDALSGVGMAQGIAHPIIDSPSYVDLIQGLGGLMAGSEGRLHVWAVDASWNDDGSRDQVMASRILEGVGSPYFDRVLVLVGNFHALKSVPWSANVPQPQDRLAQILARTSVAVVSLVQGFQSGCSAGVPGFHPAKDPRAAEVVLNLWDNLNTKKRVAPDAAEGAVDGVVLWTCSGAPALPARAPTSGSLPRIHLGSFAGRGGAQSTSVPTIPFGRGGTEVR